MALTYNAVQPVKALTAVGTNQAANNSVGAAESVTTFGGTSNLLGTTWTPAEVNDSGFGVILRFAMTSGTSSYLRATNFGFAIPTNETILGIQFSISAKGSGAGTASATISVNYVSCTVTTDLGTTTLGFFLQ
jgi:hypothetical protein